MLIAFAVRAKQAEAEAEVKSELLVHAPIVLEVGLYNSIAVVIFGLEAGLLVFSDAPGKQVCERIPRTNGIVAGIESENALNVRRVLLIFLRKRSVHAELQCVRAHDLGDVVTERIYGIGVVPREITGIRGHASVGAILRIASEGNGWQLCAEAVIEQRAHAEPRREWRVIDRGQDDVISSVAGHKLIK